MDQQQQLNQLIDKYALAQYREQILRSLKDSVLLQISRSADAQLAPGASKIGGQPDLRPGTPWPRRSDNSPLAFLTQINCAELQQQCPRAELPGAGILSFFYDAEEMPWGYDESHADGFKILFSPDVQPLARTAPPSHAGKTPSFFSRLFGARRRTLPQQFPACAVKFAYDLTLPEFDELKIDEQLFENYNELSAEFTEKLAGGYSASRMFGYPSAVQGEVIEETVEAKGGSKDDWLLLLQLDSVNEADMMWGDAGMLYFLIRRDDLERRDFSNMHQIMQCC